MGWVDPPRVPGGGVGGALGPEAFFVPLGHFAKPPHFTGAQPDDPAAAIGHGYQVRHFLVVGLEANRGIAECGYDDGAVLGRLDRVEIVKAPDGDFGVAALAVEELVPAG